MSEYKENNFSTFSRYLFLEIFLVIYLGIWNVIVPLIIIKQGDIVDLTIYETVLAFSAIVAIPLLATKIEKVRRGSALKIGYFIILFSGLVRFILLSNFYSLWLLTLIDIVSVCAFAAVQPLLGIYPAETVQHNYVPNAYRIRKILSTIGMVAGPLIAATASLYFATSKVLLIAVFIAFIGFGYSVSLPRGEVMFFDKNRSLQQHLQEITYGVRLKWVLPPERFLTIMNLSLNIATAATVPMIIPSIIRSNHLSNSNAGLFNAVFAAGTIFGLISLGRLITNRGQQRKKFILLWSMLFIALCLLTWMSNQIVLLVLLFIIGTCIAPLSLMGMDKQTTSLPSRGRIRLTAATLMLGQLSNSVAFITVGMVVSKVGLSSLSILYFAIFIFVVFLSLKAKWIWLFLADDKDSESYYLRTHPELVKYF